jgi:hypothetical protein
MEYVKYYWKCIDDETPILIFAELDDERYSTRQVSVFLDRHIEIMGDKEEYVSEEPYPSNEEINNMGEFRIFNISKSEFEKIWAIYPNNFEDNLQYIW